jgi:hypothetical protein
VDRTNAERQRRHIGKLKAAAEDSIRLRQENTALRQKVTALEQELAQQGATAKTSLGMVGLGMEALQAARTKGSIGVARVGIGEEAATTEAPRLQIPPWVPQEERQAIEETWKLPFFDFDENARKALKRLVTDDRMRDLRKKLPEGAIASAIYALGIFPLLRPKPPSRKRAARQRRERDLQRWEQHCFKHWVKHPHPTMAYDWLTLARWACDLRDVLARLRDLLGPRSDEAWSRHWRRGPVFKDARFQPFLDEADHARKPAMNTMGAAISFLHALYHCFLSIDAEHRSHLKRLPKIARWDDPQAPRRFFMDYMSDTMEKALRPSLLEAGVAELTAVAFGLDDLKPATVRGRRRLRAA